MFHVFMGSACCTARNPLDSLDAARKYITNYVESCKMNGIHTPSKWAITDEYCVEIEHFIE